MNTKSLNKILANWTVFTKVNSKWTTDLSIKHKTVKILKENGRKSMTLDLVIVDTTPKT